LVKPYSSEQEQTANRVMQKMGRLQTWLFQKTGGRLGNSFFFMAPVCLLTTRGRKSGLPRTVPLVYLKDGDKVILVGSKAGTSKHPLWYLNMKHESRCQVQLRDTPIEMQAHDATDEEYQLYWPKLLSVYKGFETYKQRAMAASNREIPVIVLEPVH